MIKVTVYVDNAFGRHIRQLATASFKTAVEAATWIVEEHGPNAKDNMEVYHRKGTTHCDVFVSDAEDQPNHWQEMVHRLAEYNGDYDFLMEDNA